MAAKTARRKRAPRTTPPAPRQVKLSRRPAGCPTGDEQQFRQWQAQRFLQMLTNDIAELHHLERLQHHLKSFSEVVWTWRCE